MDEVFHLKAPFQPTGDQPQAIEALIGRDTYQKRTRIPLERT